MEPGLQVKVDGASVAETLGSLCDKLTIVKLKQWHTEESEEAKQRDLDVQGGQLRDEIDAYLAAAASRGGEDDGGPLTCAAHKVFDLGDLVLKEVTGSLGVLMSELAEVNCDLWHEQEKVYEVQRNPESQKDAVAVLGRLGSLNLTRTQCIDAINDSLVAALDARDTLNNKKEKSWDR